MDDDEMKEYAVTVRLYKEEETELRLGAKDDVHAYDIAETMIGQWHDVKEFDILDVEEQI
jgi:hypothetical protein